MDDGSISRSDLDGYQAALVQDLARVAARDRWGKGLMAVGWVHLAFFLICQGLYSSGDRSETHFVSLWVADLLASLGVFRLVVGPGWSKSTPLAGVILRVWVTYFILTFNAASMNHLMGWSLEWFKPSWATLATFGFATMAWLLGLRFLIPAVQMYFTGLLMIRLPDDNYLIFGLSWWVALHSIGLILERRRDRTSASEKESSPQRHKGHKEEKLNMKF
jgi:hypothetical protein